MDDTITPAEAIDALEQASAPPAIDEIAARRARLADVERAAADDVAAAIEENNQPLQMEVAMHELLISQANLRVQRDDEGNRLLIVGPIMLTVGIPMSEQAARIVARELAGGVEIASGLPAELRVPPPG